MSTIQCLEQAMFAALMGYSYITHFFSECAEDGRKEVSEKADLPTYADAV